jgi:hypothetical protein
MFTTARRLSLSSPGRIQSIASSPISVRFVLIISSPLWLCLQSGCFHNVLHQNLVGISVFPHTCHMTCPSHLIILTIYREDYTLWSCSLCSFSPVSCYLLCLRSKYLLQYRNLEHPHSLFFPLLAKFPTHSYKEQNYNSA